MTVSALASATNAPIPVLDLAGSDEEVAATLKEAGAPSPRLGWVSCAACTGCHVSSAEQAVQAVSSRTGYTGCHLWNSLCKLSCVQQAGT